MEEPGSFRDPHSRVFYEGSEVRRVLSDEGYRDYELLAKSGLLEDPRVIRTSLIPNAVGPDLLPGDAAGVLRHDRVPFISYPYEWTFSMLKDAALLQLDLIQEALDRDLMLKDATPYNVAFSGSRAVFIDVGSFEKLREQELWVGYRQFCTLYLFPLLLQATKGLDFQPWLRGSREGISPAQMRGLMSFRDRFRRGYLTHVFLNARLDRPDRKAGDAVARRVERPGLGRTIIAANVRKMRRIVDRLDWQPRKGVWLGYGASNTYTAEDAEAKDTFVRDVGRSRQWGLVWDLGCNDGRHSRLVAPFADHVVAIDSDHATTDQLYQRLRNTDEGTSILPLTVDLADPSPALGWRGQERKSLDQRGQPDLVLALALVHHLVISANIPLTDVVRWLASLGGALVVEFPSRDDPMVRRLLASKREGLHSDYEQPLFEAALHAAMDVQRSEALRSGTRTLYFATPKPKVTS